ncbi:MAG: redoxin domain-containing protein [Myxococcales bacterium]|nr:redoxin domain-containing protein [Myxococcales bacterium]
MKTALLLSAAVGVITITGCGSSDAGDPPKQNDFDHGTVVNNGTGGAAGGTSTTEPPFTAYEYPAGPYGTQVGSIIEPLALLGWTAPRQAGPEGYDNSLFEPVNVAQYYNPTGAKPIKLLWINSSAVWCGPCNEEYRYMRDNKTYQNDIKPLGVELFGTLMEDGANPPNPAKPVNLTSWGVKYEVEAPMGLDPAFKVAKYFKQATVPGGLFVDTKTMKIVEILSGGSVPDVCCDSSSCYAAPNDECQSGGCSSGQQCVSGVLSKLKSAVANL